MVNWENRTCFWFNSKKLSILKLWIENFQQSVFSTAVWYTVRLRDNGKNNCIQAVLKQGIQWDLANTVSQLKFYLSTLQFLREILIQSAAILEKSDETAE